MHENDYHTARHKRKSQWSKNSSKMVDFKIKRKRDDIKKTSSIVPLNIEAAQTEVFPSIVASIPISASLNSSLC